MTNDTLQLDPSAKGEAVEILAAVIEPHECEEIIWQWPDAEIAGRMDALGWTWDAAGYTWVWQGVRA